MDKIMDLLEELEVLEVLRVKTEDAYFDAEDRMRLYTAFTLDDRNCYC